MGKLKTKNWQYSSSKEKEHDPGLLRAVKLADYSFQMEKAARRVLAADKAVRAIVDEEVDSMTNQFTDWDLGCAALVLHRRYGYDADECGAFLTDIQNLTGEFFMSGMNHDDIWNVVRDEIGLDINRCY